MVTFPAVAASLGDVRHQISQDAPRAGASPARAASIALAVSEATSNAIVHGYRGGGAECLVDVTSRLDDGALAVWVEDSGGGFRPLRNRPGLGLGLALIAQIADEFELNDRPGGGVVVAMRFALAG